MSVTRLSSRELRARKARYATLVAVWINGSLALVKGTAGFFGNSYALLADAIESAFDVVGSLVVWLGVRVASKPPSKKYPYGRGRAEAIAGFLVSLALYFAACGIAVASIIEILSPHHAPEPFTLLVLLVVVVLKECLFRYVHSVGEDVESVAVKTDAWHHRSDAITSAAAFVGISVALIGGAGYESADDWAALFAAGVIAFNAYRLMLPAVRELVDRSPGEEITEQVRRVAMSVQGVLGTHKCHVRKLGFDYYVDLDILVDPDATVRRGHDLAHQVGNSIHSQLPSITKVLVHVEPADDYGRHLVGDTQLDEGRQE